MKKHIGLEYVWLGYGVAFFLFAFLFLFADSREGSINEYLTVVQFSYFIGIIFYFIQVHKLHRTLRDISPDYPISPGAAIGWHFLIFYNLYWVVKWPKTMVNFLKSKDSSLPIKSGVTLGLLLVAAILLKSLFDPSVGIAVFIGVVHYLTIKLNRFIENEKQASLT